MKQYLLSVKDLKRIYEIGNYDGREDKWDMSPTIKRFLKSKKPVVVITEGKIYSGWDSWNIGDYYRYMFKEFLDKYDGKKVKIIVEKK